MATKCHDLENKRSQLLKPSEEEERLKQANHEIMYLKFRCEQFERKQYPSRGERFDFSGT